MFHPRRVNELNPRVLAMKGPLTTAMGNERTSEMNSAALEVLNRTFRGGLLRYFGRRVRGQAELEDMVQEVFLRLLRRGENAAIEVDNLDAYVFETASSVIKDRLRRQRTRLADAHEPFQADLHQGEDFSPERVLSAKQDLAQATAILLELPERTRVVFILRRLEGMRFKDIAVRLGVSVSAVEKHMQRAVVHLMRRMERP